MKSIDKLKKLLNIAKNTEEFAWLSKMKLSNADLIVSEKGKVAPRKNIIELYSVRKKINDDRGMPIKGFEVLIKRLNYSNSEGIVIHQMEDNKNDYRIFTDPNIDELFGVLKIPKIWGVD